MSITLMRLNVIGFMTTASYDSYRDRIDMDKIQSSISHRNSLASFEAQSSIMHERTSDGTDSISLIYILHFSPFILLVR